MGHFAHVLPKLVLVSAVALITSSISRCTAQERTIALVFGPARDLQTGPSLADIAARVHQWLQVPKTNFELRRPRERSGQELVKSTAPEALAEAVAGAAKSGRETDTQRFVDSLDLSVYSLAKRAGSRYLVVVLDPPELNDDQANRIQQAIETSKQRQIKVLLLDTSAPGAKTHPIWKSLAESTGGAVVRDFQSLDASLSSQSEPVAADPPKKQISPAPVTPAGPVVYTHFFRTAPASAKGSGSTLAPMRGFLIAESPMQWLQFDVQGGNYSARIKVNVVAKTKSGEVAWQAGKLITVKTPASRLDTRKSGTLFFHRELQLPAGDYAVEATFEDLGSGKSGSAQERLVATDSIPGLAVSGVLFVRKLAKSADVMEGDQVLQLEGEALAPMLNPTFPAGKPFELPVYFLFYPDLNGKRPQLRLDILSKGDVVGGTELAFTDNLRDDARSGGTGIRGEQKHEFPYLAKLANAMFSAGDYEVRIIVRQGRTEVTRTVPFRVIEAP